MSMQADEDRLVPVHELIGRKALTPEQGEANRKLGHRAVRARPAVKGLIPMSPVTLWRHVKSGRFPAPVTIGGVRGWRLSEIRALIAAREGDTDDRKAAP